ncbi:hypothetical protein M758_UG123400 [Ceratodon purpureus]|nr:hypothetical protein M758_UG123400 [Ceratodon purpureus]
MKALHAKRKKKQSGPTRGEPAEPTSTDYSPDTSNAPLDFTSPPSSQTHTRRSKSTIRSSAILSSSVDKPTFTTTTTTGPFEYAATSASAQDRALSGEMTPPFPCVSERGSTPDYSRREGHFSQSHTGSALLSNRINAMEAQVSKMASQVSSNVHVINQVLDAQKSIKEMLIILIPSSHTRVAPSTHTERDMTSPADDIAHSYTLMALELQCKAWPPHAAPWITGHIFHHRRPG